MVGIRACTENVGDMDAKVPRTASRFAKVAAALSLLRASLSCLLSTFVFPLEVDFDAPVPMFVF